MEKDAIILIEWYKFNYLKPNPDKWHLLLSDTTSDLKIRIDDECISNNSYVKILGVNFDNKLNFNIHVTKLCKQAGQKLHALARVSNFMSMSQRKLIMNAFISSQFNYCPLIWMCHSRSLNTKINRIHERALRIVYNDNISSFEDLLTKSGSVSIHHRNLQNIAIEVFKALNNISSVLMSELFTFKEMVYNLRGADKLKTSNIRTTNYGSETISYLASKIWEQVPEEIKNSSSLNVFKGKIKTWIPSSCPCRLCKDYIPNVGYLS